MVATIMHKRSPAKSARAIAVTARCAAWAMSAALLAGCAGNAGPFALSGTSSGAPAAPAAAAAAAPEPAVIKSLAEIRGECWMLTEGNKATRDVDRRVKLVEKCVDEKLKTQPTRAPVH